MEVFPVLGVSRLELQGFRHPGFVDVVAGAPGLSLDAVADEAELDPPCQDVLVLHGHEDGRVLGLEALKLDPRGVAVVPLRLPKGFCKGDFEAQILARVFHFPAVHGVLLLKTWDCPKFQQKYTMVPETHLVLQ